MSKETVARTIKCRLETSERKTRKLESAVSEYQEMASYVADVMPSIPEYEWDPHNNTIYRRVTDEFDDMSVAATVAREAGQEVASSFKSWRSNGKPGERPSFGRGDYLVVASQQYEVVENERGYGLKAKFIPYEPEWWHLNVGAYQREFLERAVDGDASLGSARLRVNDGEPVVELTVTWSVEVPDVSDVERRIGVDVGESTLYAAAVRDVESGDVEAVEMESGNEFRHHRERLSKRRDELQQKGDLDGVKKTRNERERYTDQVTHRVSREIVKLAVEYAPAVIRLEDLTGYRESATDAIHDWPYQQLQEKILYKAVEEGVPVQTVPAYHTSVTCRKCENQDADQRFGPEFECVQCGYEVHADVNAAMNIALRTPGN